MSSGWVEGVIRSTILLGKVIFTVAHSASSGSWAWKKERNALRAVLPLCCKLSQDKIVIGPFPTAFLFRNPSATKPKVVFGLCGCAKSYLIFSLSSINSLVAFAILYPPSVIVSVMIWIFLSAILLIMAAGFSIPQINSINEPI